MTPFRIALASLPFPASPEDSVARVEAAIAEAGAAESSGDAGNGGLASAMRNADRLPCR